MLSASMSPFYYCPEISVHKAWPTATADQKMGIKNRAYGDFASRISRLFFFGGVGNDESLSISAHAKRYVDACPRACTIDLYKLALNWLTINSRLFVALAVPCHTGSNSAKLFIALGIRHNVLMTTFPRHLKRPRAHCLPYTKRLAREVP